jgi:hypothetical protein
MSEKPVALYTTTVAVIAQINARIAALRKSSKKQPRKPKPQAKTFVKPQSKVLTQASALGGKPSFDQGGPPNIIASFDQGGPPNIIALDMSAIEQRIVAELASPDYKALKTPEQKPSRFSGGKGTHSLKGKKSPRPKGKPAQQVKQQHYRNYEVIVDGKADRFHIGEKLELAVGCHHMHPGDYDIPRRQAEVVAKQRGIVFPYPERIVAPEPTEITELLERKIAREKERFMKRALIAAIPKVEGRWMSLSEFLEGRK